MKHFEQLQREFSTGFESRFHIQIETLLLNPVDRDVTLAGETLAHVRALQSITRPGRMET